MKRLIYLLGAMIIMISCTTSKDAMTVYDDVYYSPKIKLLQHKRQSLIIRLHTALKERLKNTNNLHRHKANLLKQMQHPAINRLNIWITTIPNQQTRNIITMTIKVITILIMTMKQD